MSRTLEVCIPSCDVEIMDALAQIHKAPFEVIFQACILFGMCGMSNYLDVTPTRTAMKAWCASAHAALSSALAVDTDTDTPTPSYVPLPPHLQRIADTCELDLGAVIALWNGGGEC